MRRHFVKTLLLAATLTTTATQAAEWRPLLNEKLTGWEKWLGRPHPTVTGLPADLPLDPDSKKPAPLGLNNDPKNVFTIQIQDGEPILHITGEIWGGLTTLETFTSFHLRTQFKWGEAKWAPRLDRVRDNGILYHCNGPHGVAGSNWKNSLEYQVQEKDIGDFWQVGGTRAEIRALPDGDRFFYNPTAQYLQFGQPDKDLKPDLKPSVAHLPGDFEKPHGQWNDLELYVIADQAIHVVNGKIVLALKSGVTLDPLTKQEKPLTSGQLQIQSESAECYYRRLEISPLTEFPPALKSAAGL